MAARKHASGTQTSLTTYFHRRRTLYLEQKDLSFQSPRLPGGHLLPAPASIGDNEMTTRQRSELLTPAEVAPLLRVNPKTVTRWAKADKLSSIRTLGGHRRYRRDEVFRVLEGDQAIYLDEPTKQSAEKS